MNEDHPYHFKFNSPKPDNPMKKQTTQYQGLKINLMTPEIPKENPNPAKSKYVIGSDIQKYAIHLKVREVYLFAI